MNLLRLFSSTTRSLTLPVLRRAHLESTSKQLPVWTQPKNESTDVKRRRLLYQSRKRGMLENDLL